VGATVLAVDVREMKATVGVVRVTADLAEMSWELWVAQVCAEARVSRGRLRGIVAGVPCTTYSHADATNERKGRQWNYRDHRTVGKEPQHPSGTRKGNLARAHDWVSEGALKALRASGLPWLLENPEALLRYRPHMQEAEAQLRTVHYCAYWTEREAKEGKPCKKPTNVWTNVERWKPAGSTGTGKCEPGRCKWGRWQEGRWVHQQLQGQRALVKQRTPQKLVEEWMRASDVRGRGTDES
jgi:hypothetical protein